MNITLKVWSVFHKLNLLPMILHHMDVLEGQPCVPVQKRPGLAHSWRRMAFQRCPNPAFEPQRLCNWRVQKWQVRILSSWIVLQLFWKFLVNRQMFTEHWLLLHMQLTTAKGFWITMQQRQCLDTYKRFRNLSQLLSNWGWTSTTGQRLNLRMFWQWCNCPNPVTQIKMSLLAILLLKPFAGGTKWQVSKIYMSVFHHWWIASWRPSWARTNERHLLSLCGCYFNGSVVSYRAHRPNMKSWCWEPFYWLPGQDFVLLTLKEWMWIPWCSIFRNSEVWFGDRKPWQQGTLLVSRPLGFAAWVHLHGFTNFWGLGMKWCMSCRFHGPAVIFWFQRRLRMDHFRSSNLWIMQVPQKFFGTCCWHHGRVGKVHTPWTSFRCNTRFIRWKRPCWVLAPNLDPWSVTQIDFCKGTTRIPNAHWICMAVTAFGVHCVINRRLLQRFKMVGGQKLLNTEVDSFQW